MKRIGIIIIAFAILTMIISFFFAKGYNPQIGILASLNDMKIVLKKGRPPGMPGDGYAEIIKRYSKPPVVVSSIPLKVVWAVDLIIIFAGICLIVWKKQSNRNQYNL